MTEQNSDIRTKPSLLYDIEGYEMQDSVMVVTPSLILESKSYTMDSNGWVSERFVRRRRTSHHVSGFVKMRQCTLLVRVNLLVSVIFHARQKRELQVGFLME